ncbi:hypothetical protein BV25DRAFT_224060 [Artomyces pyxidatus]|uniref:Uncharacterized protein n=1 Tax=Artomyces pyxidatus TaxID=48021 RepID=A0ACB8TAD2_9AGAM|nr:hypothetical protein BV25DRAFT_224060 [Artomyces pyxidatus]
MLAPPTEGPSTTDISSSNGIPQAQRTLVLTEAHRLGAVNTEQLCSYSHSTYSFPPPPLHVALWSCSRRYVFRCHATYSDRADTLRQGGLWIYNAFTARSMALSYAIVGLQGRLAHDVSGQEHCITQDVAGKDSALRSEWVPLTSCRHRNPQLPYCPEDNV